MTTAAAPPRAASGASVAASWADVRLLAYVAAADLVFVAGVVEPYLTRDDNPTTFVPAWLGWPAFATIFVLPLVAVAVGALAGSRLGAAGSRRRLSLATLVLAVAGFATYVSPIGISAIRWFLD